ncbi:uncharacterized protein AKAME5_001621700 [Lates japonicus]|uniref:Uncharacterized protein n=1 Tax=Lates japonicus TaxID=270547 RepID=A0AAD3N3M0_LATJO|nr:uncharacterized protein AKAME5_001621700 [Lates japonicus]
MEDEAFNPSAGEEEEGREEDGDGYSSETEDSDYSASLGSEEEAVRLGRAGGRSQERSFVLSPMTFLLSTTSSQSALSWSEGPDVLPDSTPTATVFDAGHERLVDTAQYSTEASRRRPGSGCDNLSPAGWSFCRTAFFYGDKGLTTGTRVLILNTSSGDRYETPVLTTTTTTTTTSAATTVTPNKITTTKGDSTSTEITSNETSDKSGLFTTTVTPNKRTTTEIRSTTGHVSAGMISSEQPSTSELDQTRTSTNESPSQQSLSTIKMTTTKGDSTSQQYLTPKVDKTRRAEHVINLGVTFTSKIQLSEDDIEELVLVEFHNLLIEMGLPTSIKVGLRRP